MKSLLLGLLMAASMTGFGQATDADVKALVEKALSNKRTADGRKHVTALPRQKAAGSLPLQGYIRGKNVPAGVYALAGGMPCIVPDRTRIAAITNAFGPVSVPFRTSIPNAHSPTATPPSK